MHSDAAERAPFERLARMIETELELIADGRLDEFHAAVATREAYLQTLPMPAPASVRGTLVRIQALHGRVEIEAQRVREQLGLERSAAARTRRAVRGYAASAAPPLFSTPV